MTRQGKRWLVVLSWLAAYFRYPALFANSFHSDEALFASWARLIAIWKDPLLQGQPIDKPPLLFYLQAVFYPLQGPVEWAARMPGFIASVLLIPLLGMLVWRLYRDELATVLSSLVLAMSPLAIQFSATAFTDPLLSFVLVTSLCFVMQSLRTNPPPDLNVMLAGFWFGAAVATKYQAWLFLPLLMGMASLSGWRRRHWWQAVLAFIPWLVLMLFWEMARNGRFDIWSTQISNFGGIRPIWSWELGPRWGNWLRLWEWVAAVPQLLLLLPLALLPFRKAKSGRIRWTNRLIILFLAGFFGLHWLLAIPVWDRYLLPLVPLVAMLVGWTMSQFSQIAVAHPNSHRSDRPNLFDAPKTARKLIPVLLLVALLLIQLPTAAGARQGDYPIGGRADADQGAARLAQFLAEAPYGTVLYDHWFSWQWRYHLLDSRVFVSWFPHPDALVTDLIAFAGDGSTRYLALPGSDIALPVKRAVNQAGFQLLPVMESGSVAIELFQILPQRASNE